MKKNENVFHISDLGGKAIFSDDFPDDKVSAILLQFDEPQDLRKICKHLHTMQFHKDMIFFKGRVYDFEKGIWLK